MAQVQITSVRQISGGKVQFERVLHVGITTEEGSTTRYSFETHPLPPYTTSQPFEVKNLPLSEEDEGDPDAPTSKEVYDHEGNIVGVLHVLVAVGDEHNIKLATERQAIDRNLMDAYRRLAQIAEDKARIAQHSVM